MKKHLSWIIVVILIGIVIFLLMKPSTIIIDTNDSNYKDHIDSLQKKIEYYEQKDSIEKAMYDSMSLVNNDLKKRYEDEKNKSFYDVFNLDIDSTIKYWSAEFSKIGCY